MMAWKPALAAGVILVFLSPSVAARSITFEERVRAQERIQRLYYSYRSQTTKPFEESVSRETLVRQVRDYLDRSIALEQFWNRPITADALHRETERMARGSRRPARLRELYIALGNDAFVFQECVARRILARRLTLKLFGYDTRIHGERRREIEAVRGRLASGDVDPEVEHPDRRVLELVRVDLRGKDEPRRGGGVVELSPEEYDRVRARAPERIGGVGRIKEDLASFSFQVLLSEDSDRMELAIYRRAKRTWEDWWGDMRPRYGQHLNPGVASDSSQLPQPGPPGGSAQSNSSFPEECLAGPDDLWDNGILGLLLETEGGTAVWTGSEMIIWGGGLAFTARDIGARYDPLLDVWTPVLRENAPEPRQWHSAVWTGSEMIVWGGHGATVGELYDTGGRYDPLTDTWTPMSTLNAPEPRRRHTAVWTGNEMIVWGGAEGTNPPDPIPFNTGGRYDPVLDSWTATSLSNVPDERTDHSAVWTGSEMIVWGGKVGTSTELNTGGHYDPVSDSWTPTPMTGAPSARYYHSAVWTGSEMIVFGGQIDDYGNPGGIKSDGAIYDPGVGLFDWTPISTVDAPDRAGHAAVWTGSEMIVFGGRDPSGGFAAGPGGERYDPIADTWTPLPDVGLANWSDPRTAGVWTGSEMLVWFRGHGGRYDPSQDLWIPIHPVGLAGKVFHSAVWTGNEMIVWGGSDGVSDFNTGGRYDPMLDSWDSTSLSGAPEARDQHSGVWTGSEMIVWGGFPNLTTGGRYDPMLDSWNSTSVSGAPEARVQHTTAWTGSEMIVWGGLPQTGGELNTGGRYDPVEDSWSPTSILDAPQARKRHTAVWTGSEMVVWGGEGDSTPPPSVLLNSGGRYDPNDDEWTPTSTIAVPEPARRHTSVWTGSEMIVWGGLTGARGRYDPVRDSWAPVTVAEAPEARELHTAVWTGEEMIVWGGGFDNDGGQQNTGGRYDPVRDAWSETSIVDAPIHRNRHTAVWTDEEMIVWGGWYDYEPGFRSGGIYLASADWDADGIKNSCDCGPDDSSVFAIPSEIADLRWQEDTKENFEWDSDAPNSGTGTVYDVMRGDLDQFPVGTGLSEVCLEPGSTDTAAEDTDTPPAGSGTYYLIRGVNSCGAGSYGFESGDIERTTTICP